jgi:hypothetical protein
MHREAQDIYNNLHWRHKIKTEAVLAAEKDVLPDLSSFYGRFGAGGGYVGRGRAQGPAQAVDAQGRGKSTSSGKGGSMPTGGGGERASVAGSAGDAGGDDTSPIGH